MKLIYPLAQIRLTDRMYVGGKAWARAVHDDADGALKLDHVDVVGLRLGLDEQDARLLELTHRDFVRSGAALSAEAGIGLAALALTGPWGRASLLAGRQGTTPGGSLAVLLIVLVTDAWSVLLNADAQRDAGKYVDQRPGGLAGLDQVQGFQ